MQNVELKNESFEKVTECANKWDFVYLDPPYDTLSNTANFTDYNKWWFGWNQQENLYTTYKKLDEKWCCVMLSNHNTDRIKSLYKDYTQKIVKATRMINSKAENRWAIDEIVVLNYE